MTISPKVTALSKKPVKPKKVEKAKLFTDKHINYGKFKKTHHKAAKENTLKNGLMLKK